MSKTRTTKLAMAIAAILILAGLVLYSNRYVESPATPTTPTTPKEIPEHFTTGPGGIAINFVKSVRSGSEDVNRFVFEFMNILLANDYKAYRRHVTQKREPITLKRFEAAYGKVRKIDVLGIEKVADPSTIDDADLGTLTGDVYRLKTHIELQGDFTREVEILIFREDDAWVSSH